MRITCQQCGQNINSQTCVEYCDFDARQKQFDEAKETSKKYLEALEKQKQNKKNIRLIEEDFLP